MQVIPSIDLWQGQVVRLLQGDYGKVTVYAEDPAALASGWRRHTDRLHIVDLAGAKEGRPVQVEQIRSVISAFGPGVQIGGGVRSLQAVEAYFELGVERVVIGTAAVKDPELVRQACRRYPGRVVVALDAKSGFVATGGWTEVSEQRVTDLAKSYAEDAVAALLYTDIERDGTEVGPNVAATAELARHSGLPVIASGGVGTLSHLERLGEASREVDGGIVGAIIGRSLHERRFTLAEAVRAASGAAA